jgi:hypothetical protein
MATGAILWALLALAYAWSVWNLARMWRAPDRTSYRQGARIEIVSDATKPAPTPPQGTRRMFGK